MRCLVLAELQATSVGLTVRQSVIQPGDFRISRTRHEDTVAADEVRHHVNLDLGFSPEDRIEPGAWGGCAIRW
jgi:hypothetical protein